MRLNSLALSDAFADLCRRAVVISARMNDKI